MEIQEKKCPCELLLQGLGEIKTKNSTDLVLVIISKELGLRCAGVRRTAEKDKLTIPAGSESPRTLECDQPREINQKESSPNEIEQLEEEKKRDTCNSIDNPP